MAERFLPIRVFLASPGDVRKERDKVKLVVDQINRGAGSERGFFLDLWRWETDSYPQLHLEGAQGAIDAQSTIERCDILIGIFWTRFGTQIKGGETGTEHEINIAYRAWNTKRRPQVMMYFKNRAYLCTSKHETDQWGKVLEYKQTLPEKGFKYDNFTTSENFEGKLRDHVQQMIGSIINPTVRDLTGSPTSDLVSDDGEQPPATVEFVNLANEEVTLFWIRPSGELKRYLSLAAGKRHRQPTHIGHVWAAVNKQKRILSQFKIKVRESVAEIMEQSVLTESDPLPSD